ncbi:hypothetical protein BSL78_04806 [Apostichopus japonicus]|uniref:BEN domain-containing protein n=1 Tax=Stichopus japonicus TaxID=307972 RepID=A0A2G8LDR2_STIJA|nr:hypothetical protein BSL78_04806 [Apostichopus japonicus]
MLRSTTVLQQSCSMASNSVNLLYFTEKCQPSKKAKSAAGQDIIELLLSQHGSCQDGDSAHSDDRDDGSDDVETKLEFLRRQNGILKDRLDESAKKVEAAQTKIEDLERTILKVNVEKAMLAKDYGKLVCQLMRTGFTREDMATSSLTGKSKSGETRNKLDEKKVEEMIRLTLLKFNGVSRTAIRSKMAEKMKDDRKAYHLEEQK